jgi:hypothetical protein
MIKTPARHHSYLLRFWQEERWRFMLENPHSGEKRGFDSLETLVTFLEAELAGGRDPAGEKERGT